MAQNISSGTASGGAEQTLYDATGNATFIIHVDVNELVDGDTLILRAKSPGDGGTYRTHDVRDLVGGMLDGKDMISFGPHAHSDGVRYTLEQPLGTTKDFAWTLDAL